MSPDFTSQDCVHYESTYAIFKGESFLRYAAFIVTFPRFLNLLLVQFCSSVKRSFSRVLSISRLTITHVLHLSSRVQMSGIAAQWRVTCMENKLSRWYRPVVEHIRNAVCLLVSSAYCDVPIAAYSAWPPTDSALPKPAIRRRRAVNLRPEPLSKSCGPCHAHSLT